MDKATGKFWGSKYQPGIIDNLALSLSISIMQDSF